MQDEIRGLSRLGLSGIDIDELLRVYDASATDTISVDDAYALIINICSSKIAQHPDYDDVTKHFFLKDLYARTSPSFSKSVQLLHGNNVVSDEFAGCVEAIKDTVDAAIVHERDDLLSFFGLKTMQNGYMLKTKHDGVLTPVERPQYVFMSVAIAIHGTAVRDVLETYDAMSQKYFIHATPTLFNAGAKSQQLSSCFLMQVRFLDLDCVTYAHTCVCVFGMCTGRGANVCLCSSNVP